MEVHERHGIGRRDDGGEPDGAGAGDGVEARADGAGAGDGDGVEARAGGAADKEGRAAGAR